MSSKPPPEGGSQPPTQAENIRLFLRRTISHLLLLGAPYLVNDLRDALRRLSDEGQIPNLYQLLPNPFSASSSSTNQTISHSSTTDYVGRWQVWQNAKVLWPYTAPMNAPTNLALGQACRDIGENFIEAGETGAADVIGDICGHFPVTPGHLRTVLTDAEADGFVIHFINSLRGSLPVWLTDLPAMILGQGNWTSWISWLVRRLSERFWSHPHEALVLALLLIAIFRRLRRDNNVVISNGDNQEQPLLPVEWRNDFLDMQLPLPMDVGDEVPDVQHPQVHEQSETDAAMDDIPQLAVQASSQTINQAPVSNTTLTSISRPPIHPAQAPPRKIGRRKRNDDDTQNHNSAPIKKRRTQRRHQDSDGKHRLQPPFPSKISINGIC